jgi:hypothetical protein
VTRYFCDDVSHWRDGQPRTVDVTAQVQLELGSVVHREAYSADVHDVIDRVRELTTDDPSGRRAEIRRILTGSTMPSRAPVRLVDGRAGTTSDVIRLPEAAPRSNDPGTVSTRADRRTETGTVTGTFPADELATRLAAAERTPDALVDAVRHTPAFDVRSADRVGRPWRVVIACPVLEGNPPVEHRVVFAGTGDTEQLDVFGIPASNWDLALEASATTDLTPSRGARRAERLLGGLLIAEVVVAVALACTTWITGGLGMAAREAPGWLLLAIILAVGAMAFAAVGLVGPRSPEGNVNDTLVVSRFYASRTEMLWIAAAVSIALFGASLVIAFAGPLASNNGAIPTPTVSFDTTGRSVTATIDLDAANIGIDERPTVTLRTFNGHTDAGTTIGTVVATGTSDGRIVLHDVVGLPPGADFLAVLVNVDGHGPTACSPLGATDPGCTLLAIPQRTGGTSAPIIGIGAASTSTATATAPTASASASASAAPSATTSASTSPATSVSPASPTSSIATP